MFTRPYWMRDEGLLRFARFDPLSAVGAVAGVVGTISQISSAKKAANANAAIAAQNAQLAKEAAEFEERRTRQETERVLSAQRAAAGASGSALDGSALSIMLETAYESELDALFIRRTGIIDATRFNLQADAFRAQGNAAVIGGILGAGSDLLSDLGDLGDVMPGG